MVGVLGETVKFTVGVLGETVKFTVGVLGETVKFTVGVLGETVKFTVGVLVVYLVLDYATITLTPCPRRMTTNTFFAKSLTTQTQYPHTGSQQQRGTFLRIRFIGLFRGG